MEAEKKIEMLETVSELLHTEGHEPVYDSSEAQIFWDARTFVERCISRIRIHAGKDSPQSRKERREKTK